MIAGKDHQNQEHLPNERLSADQPFEATLKDKFGIYLQKKHLVEELFSLEQHQQILEPFNHTWRAGGKRLRVITAMLINDLYQEILSDDVVRIGGVVELLHNASLLIDDIQDGSTHRRGQPCSHVVYGVDSAINSANLLYFLPLQKLTQSLSAVQLRWKVAQVYLREMALCHVGQGIDVYVHHATSESELPSKEEYMLLVSHKTGGLMRMLVGMLGAVLSIPQENVSLLREGLTQMGVAFQITDDMLNLTNSDNMGKEVTAEDLHQRKFTLIVHCLRNHSQFMKLFFTKQKTERDIKTMLQMIYSSSALQQCREQANRYSVKAYDCIDKLDCPRSKNTFRQFINYIINRKQ